LIGFWIFYIQGRWERKLYFKKIFLLGILVFIFLHLFGGLTTPIKKNFEYPVAIWQTNIPTREKLKINLFQPTEHGAQSFTYFFNFMF